MIRPLILAAALAAASAPAFAAEADGVSKSITVSLAGKSPAAIRADIAHAASLVCAAVYADDPRELHSMAVCADQAREEALAKIGGATAVASAKPSPAAMTVATR